MKRYRLKQFGTINLLIVLGLIFTAGALTGCNEDSVEDAVEDVEDGAEDLGDNIEEGVEEIEDEIDDATTD